MSGLKALFKKKWFLPLVLAPGPILLVVVMGLRLRSEMAHNDETCPFETVTERSRAFGQVIEQARRCQPGVEEHRWQVQSNDGGEPVELGRRRLSEAHFAPGAYAWSEQDGPEGCVVVLISDRRPQASGEPPLRFSNCSREYLAGLDQH